MKTLEKLLLGAFLSAATLGGAYLSHRIERHYAATHPQWQHHGIVEEYASYVIGAGAGFGFGAVAYQILDGIRRERRKDSALPQE